MWHSVSNSGAMIMEFLLLICAALSTVYVIERIKTFNKIYKKIKNHRELENLKTAFQEKGLQEIKTLFSKSKNPFSNLLNDIFCKYENLKSQGLNRENLRNEILIFAGDLSSKSINKHLSIIGTVANISPLIGLLGTVFGVSSVLNLARMNSADLNEGISKSLIPVALGLAIGILSVIFHRFLSRVAQILSGHFENYSDSLVQSLLATKTYPKPVRDNSQRRFHQYPRQPQQQQHQSQQQRQQNRDVFRNRRNPPYKGRHIASPNKTTENIETPENRKPDPQKEEKKFFGELPN